MVITSLENEKVKNLYGLIKGKAEKVFEEQNNYIQRYFNRIEILHHFI